MASVEITRREAEQRQLPPVCMRCGEAARQTYQTDFFDGRGRILLFAPLCYFHRNHFKWRTRVLVFGLVGSIFVLGLGIFVIADGIRTGIENGIGGGRTPFKFLISIIWLLIGLCGAVGSIVTFLVFKYTGIRVTGVTYNAVTFTEVAPEFVEALRVQRQIKEEAEVKAPVVMPEGTELDDWRDALALADDARHALHLAEDAALNEGDDHLGTEHLLLGLRDAIPSVAAYILKSLAVEGQGIYERLEQADDARRPEQNHLPMTPAVKRILQSAVDDASNLKRTLIASEHILLALLDESDSEAVHILRSLDVDLEVMRKMILNPSGQGQFKAGEPLAVRSTQFRPDEQAQ
jgi:hypothetical protein